MRREEREFVERWSRILASEGLPPVAGRLWAWLLVCEPRGADRRPDQRGHRGQPGRHQRRRPVAGAVGADPPVRRPGDRRDHWSTTPDAMVRVIENRQRQMRPSLDTLESAIDRAWRTARPSRWSGSVTSMRSTRCCSASSVDAVEQYTDAPRGRRPPASQRERIEMPAIIRTERLTKSYGATEASSTSTSRSRAARCSGSSARTAPARRPRSAPCST